MEALETVKRVSATTQVIETIKSAIESGKLKVGDRLPNEMELAKSIGVGRSTLREGLRMLSSFGIVEIKHGEGTFVADKYAQRIFEFLGYESNKENIAYMLEVRKIIELASIRIAVNKASDEELNELAPLVEKISNVVGNATEAEAADRQFHERIVSLSGNPLLVEIYKMMSKMLSIVFHELMCHDEVAYDAHIYHMSIMEMLNRRNAEESVKAMESHLDKVSYYAQKYKLTI